MEALRRNRQVVVRIFFLHRGVRVLSNRLFDQEAQGSKLIPLDQSNDRHVGVKERCAPIDLVLVDGGASVVVHLRRSRSYRVCLES